MPERAQPGDRNTNPAQAATERAVASEPSRALRGLQRAQTELDRALARRLRLRALDYAAMVDLLTADSPIGPVELADQLGISSGSGTELADRLERAGHLHRRPATADRRRVLLEPDQEARAAIRRTISPLIDSLNELAATLTDSERDTIVRYLTTAAALTKNFANTLAERDRETP